MAAATSAQPFPPHREPLIRLPRRAGAEQQMVDEAFVRLMVNASELGTAEVRAEIAWRGWKQLRLAMGSKPKRGADVRYAVAATEWVDPSGGMTDEFLDYLQEIEDERRELKAGQVEEGADEEGVDDAPGLLDRVRNLLPSLTNVGESEVDQPTVDLGPPLALPAEEPSEGYLEYGLRKLNETFGKVKDVVLDNTIRPVLEDVEDKANKLKNAAIGIAVVLGGLWLLSRSSR